MDSRNVFAKLFSSRAFVFALFILAIVGALVALGKAPHTEFIATAKWLGCVFIAGKSAESVFGDDPQRTVAVVAAAFRDSMSGPPTPKS